MLLCLPWGFERSIEYEGKDRNTKKERKDNSLLIYSDACGSLRLRVVQQRSAIGAVVATTADILLFCVTERLLQNVTNKTKTLDIMNSNKSGKLTISPAIKKRGAPTDRHIQFELGFCSMQCKNESIDLPCPKDRLSCGSWLHYWPYPGPLQENRPTSEARRGYTTLTN